MDARRRVKAEDLVEIREQQIAMSLVLAGEFDVQIAEMRRVKEELEATQLIGRTLAEAEQIKHAAVQFSETERGEVAGIVEKAEQHRLEILSHVGEAKATLERAQQEKDLTTSAYLDMEREQKRWDLHLTKAETDLKRRQDMCAEREASVAGELEKLRVLQDKLKTRLAKLETV